MKAKAMKNISILLSIAVCIAALSSCSEEIKDFGFDGQISGMILDQNGNPVSGDVSNSDLTVFLLGELDRVALQVRVNADGSYANLHLYPQAYTVWIEGPIDAPGEQVVNLNGGLVEQNITVTPFLVISEPTASITGGDLSVSYQIEESTGHLVQDMVVLVSTVAKVGVNTGDGPRWITREEDLITNSGTVTVPLDAELLDMSEERGGGNLHIRIAARSDQSSDWNYSMPIVIAAP